MNKMLDRPSLLPDPYHALYDKLFTIEWNQHNSLLTLLCTPQIELTQIRSAIVFEMYFYHFGTIFLHFIRNFGQNLWFSAYRRIPVYMRDWL